MVEWLESLWGGVESVFNSIVEGFTKLGALVVEGFEKLGEIGFAMGESLLNAIMLGFATVVNTTFELLPEMSDAPSVGSPEWLNWLNWFFPIPTLVAGLISIVALYVLFLAVRYVLKVMRAL